MRRLSYFTVRLSHHHSLTLSPPLPGSPKSVFGDGIGNARHADYDIIRSNSTDRLLLEVHLYLYSTQRLELSRIGPDLAARPLSLLLLSLSALPLSPCTLPYMFVLPHLSNICSPHITSPPFATVPRRSRTA